MAGQVTPPGSTPSGWTVSYPFSLPSGYDEPTGMVGDTHGGLWLFAIGSGGMTESTLFHWNGTSLSSYVVDPGDALSPGEWTPLLFDDDGNLWIGIHSTLVEFDPTTDTTLQSIDLPAVSVGTPGSGLPSLPPAPGGSATTDADPYTTIDSLALSADGDVVVGRQFATELQTVDPSTLLVNTIPLPPNTALAGLGQGDLSGSPVSGLLEVTLYASRGLHELGQLVQDSWYVSDTPCPATSTNIFNGELIVGGPQCLAAGTVPMTDVVSLSLVNNFDLLGSPCAVAISLSTVLACSQAGVIALDTGVGNSTPPVNISLGTVPVAPSFEGGSSGTVTSAPIEPTVLCAGTQGQAWFVPSSESTIGLISGPVS